MKSCTTLTLILLFSMNLMADPPKKLIDMYQSIKEDFAGIPDISPNDVDIKKVLLVDVRSKDEQAISKIPGSITQKEFNINPEKYRGKKIIPYCTIGYRSFKFTKKLKEKNFNAANMQGGILYWSFLRGNVVTPDNKPTKKVHTYGNSWAILPSGFEATW